MTEGWTMIYTEIFSMRMVSLHACVCAYMCLHVLLLMVWMQMCVQLPSYWVLNTVSFFSIKIPITSQKCSL